MSLVDSYLTTSGESDVALTEFQYTILYLLAEESNYGLGVKRRLQHHYGHEINHGQLYPNLDELAAVGLIRKGKRDDRTNEYELTEEGLSVVFDRIAFAIQRLVDDETVAESLLEELHHGAAIP